jgi:NAD(P)-dependent dehydrogenase (short-subunit alcohol dehydrogenase family)
MLIGLGASVALFDVVPPETGDKFASEVESSGSGKTKALYHKVDITDSDAVRDAVARVVDTLGNLKGVVHCAGVAIKRPWTNDVAESIPNFKKVSLSHLLARPSSFESGQVRCSLRVQMLDINVTGTFIVNAHIADAINKPLNHPDGSDKHGPFWTTDEERGVIVNFASAAANPYARVLSYGPGKTAVIGITKGE